MSLPVAGRSGRGAWVHIATLRRARGARRRVARERALCGAGAWGSKVVPACAAMQRRHQRAKSLASLSLFHPRRRRFSGGWRGVIAAGSTLSSHRSNTCVPARACVRVCACVRENGSGLVSEAVRAESHSARRLGAPAPCGDSLAPEALGAVLPLEVVSLSGHEDKDKMRFSNMPRELRN